MSNHKFCQYCGQPKAERATDRFSVETGERIMETVCMTAKCRGMCADLYPFHKFQYRFFGGPPICEVCGFQSFWSD